MSMGCRQQQGRMPTPFLVRLGLDSERALKSPSEDEEDEHGFYPGSGHPEVNSPTSCFDCIISLSGGVLQSLLAPLGSPSLELEDGKTRIQIPSSLHGALRASFIGEEKLAGEALRSARGDSGNSGGEDAGARRIAGYGGRTSVGSPGVLSQGRRVTPPVLSVLSPVS